MRATTGAFAQKLRSETTTFARLWTITRGDGRALRFTDLDRDVQRGSDIFRANPGFLASSVLLATNTEANGLEIGTSLDNDFFDRGDFLAGRYDGSSVILEIVDAAAPDDGSMLLFDGTTSTVVHDKDDNLVIDVVGRFNGDRGLRVDIYQPTCRADLGDAQCKFDIFSLEERFTITEVVGPQTFRAPELSQGPDVQGQPFWALGQVQFTTGSNNGVALEVRTNDPALNSVSLWAPTPFAMAVGDTGRIVPGCSLTFATCRDRYNNAVNFHGEPFHPDAAGGWRPSR